MGKSPYAMFATSTEIERGGVLLDYGAFKIRIARAGGANRKFASVLEAKLKPYRRQIQTESMDDEVATRLIIEAYAESVVIDWEGVVDGAGTPLPFAKENVIKLFTDLPDLFRDVQEQATKASLFRAAEVEEDEKNSATVSPTT